MSQLSLLDERMQNELARPAHWVEPRSKIRSTQRRPKVDQLAWLQHCLGCDECGEARVELSVIRARRLDVEADVVPCPAGMRLIPTEELDAYCGGLDRREARLMAQRILEQAQRLRCRA